MNLIIGVLCGLVVGLLIGLIIGISSGRKKTVSKVKQILKQENIEIDLDHVLNKKHAGTVKEDFFEIPSS